MSLFIIGNTDILPASVLSIFYSIPIPSRTPALVYFVIPDVML